METRSQSLSHIIRTARTRQLMTQGELANKIGVNQSTISFWERGAETPTVEHLILLSLALPEVIEGLPGREREMLERLIRMERDLYPGRCACSGCSCR